MKKAGLFIISLVLASLFSQIVLAQEAPGISDIPFANETQAVQQQYEQYTTAENKTDYLMTEWTTILGKAKYVGPVFKVVNAVFNGLKPLFKIVLGYDTLSWGFVFAVAIWLTLFFILYPPSAQLLNNGLFGGITSFAIVTLIGLSGTIRKAVEVINSLLKNRWAFWLAVLLAIVIVFLGNIFGKQVKSWLKNLKKESEDTKLKEAQKIIETRAESAKKELEEDDDWQPNFGNIGNR